MATLLERGIIAAQTGNKVEAKRLLTQILQQNNRHEKAWLWLTETVDTIGEKIECLEQVLEINPANKTAKLAIQRLKSQPIQVLEHAMPAHPTSQALVRSGQASNANRRPFRLTDMPLQQQYGPNVHHNVTAGTAPLLQSEAAEYGLLRQGMTNGNGHLVGNGYQNGDRIRPTRSKKRNASADGSGSIPLLPALVFGILSVTAVGGIVMILLLIMFS